MAKLWQTTALCITKLFEFITTTYNVYTNVNNNVYCNITQYLNNVYCNRYDNVYTNVNNNVYCNTIQEFAKNNSQNRYKAVIFGDVLEHFFRSEAIDYIDYFLYRNNE
jgi:nitrate reductase alpha subunit